MSGTLWHQFVTIGLMEPLEPKRTFILRDKQGDRDLGFVYACSGYLVEDGKILLVHHKGWDKWVPPGGHLEPGDSFAGTAEREFLEETGLEVKAISAVPIIDPRDPNNLPEPVPFFVDRERYFKPYPGIVQFFWVRRTDESKSQAHKMQAEELHDIGWFSLERISSLDTFEQVKALAEYSLKNHPDA